VANALHALLRKQVKDQLLTTSEIAESLAAFQKHRQARVEATYDISCKVTRLEALKGPVEKFLALYLFPNSGEFMATNLADSMIGAEKLDFLPAPERSLMGIMPFNPTQGIGKEENLLKRAAWASPLLIIAFVVWSTLPIFIRHPQLGDGNSSAAVHDHQAQWAPKVLLMVNLAPISAIWLLESNRRANTFTFARFAILFGLAAHRHGFGLIAPLYLFLHYVQSPISNFAASDQRLVNVAAARTTIPSLVMAYALPFLATYAAPFLFTQLTIDVTWQQFPIWLALMHYIIRNFFVRDTTLHDRIHQPFTDLPYIRFALKAAAIIAAVSFNIFRWQLLFTPGFASFFRADIISCMLACLCWLLLLFKDLKEVEMLQMSWVKLVASALTCACICGPGAVIAMGWLWREEILASRRAKGAVVRESD
jgi:hypothetical protein